MSFENINYNVCICFHGFSYELTRCLNPVANALPPLSGPGGASLANNGSHSSVSRLRASYAPSHHCTQAMKVRLGSPSFLGSTNVQ
jgi:hypothetical protein